MDALNAKDLDIQFTGATLLSIEEYKACKDVIPNIDADWWWLRSRGAFSFTAGAVYKNELDEEGINIRDDEVLVRPALYFNLSPDPNFSALNIGDKVEVEGLIFTVISDNIMLCDTSIGEWAFQSHLNVKDANNYELSDVKIFIDRWYTRDILKERECTKPDIENCKKIVVHNGVYHADDVIACAMLKALNPNIKITRTRDFREISEKLLDSSVIVADVGMGKYDHHDKNDIRKGISCEKPCAATLIYSDIKHRFHDSGFLGSQLATIEHLDNGIELPPVYQTDNYDVFVNNIKETIPAWDSTESMDDAFIKCVNKYASIIHDCFIQDHPLSIDTTVNYLKAETQLLKERNDLSLEKAYNIVEKAYEASPDKDVIVLPYTGMPWQHVLCDTEAKFVIYESNDQYCLQAVPPEEGSFDKKIEIPQNALDGFEDYYFSNKPFVHNSGFFAALPKFKAEDPGYGFNVDRNTPHEIKLLKEIAISLVLEREFGPKTDPCYLKAYETAERIAKTYHLPYSDLCPDTNHAWKVCKDGQSRIPNGEVFTINYKDSPVAIMTIGKDQDFVLCEETLKDLLNTSVLNNCEREEQTLDD